MYTDIKEYDTYNRFKLRKIVTIDMQEIEQSAENEIIHYGNMNIQDMKREE